MGVGCHSARISPQYISRDEPSDGLVCHNCFCWPHPLSLVAGYMCFTCPNPTPALTLHRTACAEIGSTAPSNVLLVYIISVCCVADLGTC